MIAVFHPIELAGLPVVATQHPENLTCHQSYMKSANGLIMLDRRYIRCFTHQLQAKPCRCSRWVAPIFECIDSGCTGNPVRGLIRLAAPFAWMAALRIKRYFASLVPRSAVAHSRPINRSSTLQFLKYLTDCSLAPQQR